MHTIFMIRYQIYCLSRYCFQNLWINTLYLSLKFSNFDCCLCLEHLLNLTEIWLQVKHRSFKCLLCKQSSFHDFVFKKSQIKHYLIYKVTDWKCPGYHSRRTKLSDHQFCQKVFIECGCVVLHDAECRS